MLFVLLQIFTDSLDSPGIIAFGYSVVGPVVEHRIDGFGIALGAYIETEQFTLQLDGTLIIVLILFAASPQPVEAYDVRFGLLNRQLVFYLSLADFNSFGVIAVLLGVFYAAGIETSQLLRNRAVILLNIAKLIEHLLGGVEITCSLSLRELTQQNTADVFGNLGLIFCDILDGQQEIDSLLGLIALQVGRCQLTSGRLIKLLLAGLLPPGNSLIVIAVGQEAVSHKLKPGQIVGALGEQLFQTLACPIEFASIDEETHHFENIVGVFVAHSGLSSGLGHCSCAESTFLSHSIGSRGGSAFGHTLLLGAQSFVLLLGQTLALGTRAHFCDAGHLGIELADHHHVTGIGSKTAPAL